MDANWNKQFQSTLANIVPSMTYQESAAALRNVIQKGGLELTDITKNPHRFFEAHRLLSAIPITCGPGFSIRFTVHYNLFAGTVVGLGTAEQIAALVERNKTKPRLGCFALTESLAGVNSGLVVDTRAEYKDGMFVINTPTANASKNWISQGLVADEGVVVASLTVNGVDYGPQAFLVDFRDENGKLAPGITAQDMGLK
jgi:acyl-CoA oxidase